MSLLPLALALPVGAQESAPKAAPIPVATDAPLPTVTTRQRVRLDGVPLRYRATWSEMVLDDAAGEPQATISATAYTRDGVRDLTKRPVVVLFNGGPGASSSPLHFSAFGPRMLGERDAAGNRAMSDNANTLLDVADLLFVDPVGTGFSRPMHEGGGDAYWRADGDAAAMLEFIRKWLAANGRTASPLFLVGQSYGGYRIGTMAKDMADLNVAGLVLVSPAFSFGGDEDQSVVNSLPTMAVAAWHHGKTGQPDDSVANIWENARAFAQGDYAVALQQGSLIDPARRDRIAARLAALTGLSVEQVKAAKLRLDKQLFLESLVPGSIVGRLDVRVVAPRPPRPIADRPASSNDPALGLSTTNVIVSPPMANYFRDELKVPTLRDYYSLTLDVNFRWDWGRPNPQPGAGWAVTSNIAKLMTAKPDLRLLVVGGYYDLTIPLLELRYALTHGGVPMDRTRMVAVPAGHSPFKGAAKRDDTASMVHSFLTEDRTIR